MANAPTISVVVTTYNHGSLVIEALESVLAQTRFPDEIVVVDDGSIDGTQERLAHAFGSAIRYVWQPNGGIASSRNRGIAESHGDLVALMDGDDLWHARKLEMQVHAFERYPTSGLIAVLPHIFDGESKPPSLCWDIAPPKISCSNRLRELLDESPLATTSQVVIPRHVLQVVGPSDSRYAVSSDFDLYCRIACRYPMAIVEAKLALWRYSAASASGPQEMRYLKWGPEVVEILERGQHSWGKEHRALLSSALKRQVRAVGWHAYRYGTSVDERPAAAVLRTLLARYPSDVKVWIYWALIHISSITKHLSGAAGKTARPSS